VQNNIEYFAVRSLVHDLASPVTALKLNLQMLQAHYSNNPVYVKRALQGVSQLEGLIKSQNQLGNSSKYWSLNRVLSESILSLQSVLEQGNIKVTVSGEISIKVKGPRVLMNRIITNLLMNSITALGKTKDTENEILIKLATTANAVEITFSDNGPGIPKSLAAKIFHDKISNKEVGHGFGLFALNQNLRSYFGGKIALVGKPIINSPNIQAVFKISLPV
jgi:signal transduction histidine kinase